MSGLIPDPPLDGDGLPTVYSYTVTAALHRGGYGGCVMCPDGTYQWWDLTACDMSPVVDRSGALTDQVPLHERCVPALLDYWTTLLHGDSGVGDTGPDVGVQSSEPVARARTGAYARRSDR